jgi:hypothetical protein
MDILGLFHDKHNMSENERKVEENLPFSKNPSGLDNIS